ncbi:hypothetical protein APSETT444_000175 [Aspergillus pseudonomiae]
MISDEIHAHSTYANEQFPNATTFNSILSLDLSEIIDQNLVHVLYGMSKDYGASGLRVGVLQSRNKNLTEAVSAINNAGLFVWARILPYPEDNGTDEYSKLKERFLEIFLGNGVNIADGDSFIPDNPENGWFRITFSYDEDRFSVGLERLTRSLRQIKIEMLS